MAWKPENIKKANNLIVDAIETVDEFMLDRAGPTQTEQQRAELSVIFAAVAFARAMNHCSFPRVIRLVFGAFFAARKMRDLV